MAMNENEKIEKIKKILISKLDPKLIYIFGSMLKGRTRNNSDIDVAILADREIDEYQLYMISQQLADVLRREVDLIDLRKATTVFKAEILKTGKLLYNSDNPGKMHFQLGVLQDYVFLNERRKEVIDKLTRIIKE